MIYDIYIYDIHEKRWEEMGNDLLFNGFQHVWGVNGLVLA